MNQRQYTLLHAHDVLVIPHGRSTLRCSFNASLRACGFFAFGGVGSRAAANYFCILVGF